VCYTETNNVINVHVKNALDWATFSFKLFWKIFEYVYVVNIV